VYSIVEREKQKMSGNFSRIVRYCLLTIAMLGISFAIVHAASIIVYNGGSGFEQWGTGWFYPSSGGSGGTGYQYTANSGLSGSAEGERWYAFVNGPCSVYTFVPAQFDSTQAARYFINNGSAYYLARTVNQRTSGNSWVFITSLTCAIPSLYLYDNTSEFPGTTAVLFDDTRYDY
jgi:hypothetical protein